MSGIPTREEALAIMHEYTENVNLRKHMYAVEAAMRSYAVKYGEDPDVWGVLLTATIHRRAWGSCASEGSARTFSMLSWRTPRSPESNRRRSWRGPSWRWTS